MEDENKSVEPKKKLRWFLDNWYYFVLALVIVGVIYLCNSDEEQQKTNDRQDASISALEEARDKLEKQAAETAKRLEAEKKQAEEEDAEPAQEQEPEPEPEPSYDTNAKDNCSAGDLDETETSSSASDEIIVYVTRTGEKYHRESCSYLRQSKIETTLSEAVEDGYTPCSRCHPPTE